MSKLGVKTTLISGPSNINYQKNFKLIKVISAEEMFNAVKKSLPVDVAICAAAVSDFKPIKKNKNKIKKDYNKFKTIELEKNKDILEFLGKNNRFRPKLVVGFSAETDRINKNSNLKLRKKNCDLIIANDISKKDSGFNSDYNRVSIIDNIGKVKVIKKNKKSFIANKITEFILNKLLIEEKNLN